MSDLGLLNSIQEQIDIERDKIIREASEQVEEILAKAKQEAAQIKDIAGRARQGKKEVTQTSPLVLQAKQEGMTETFAKALEQLKQLRSKPEYSNILKKLIQEACSGLSGELEVRVNPADVKLADKIVADLNISGKVVGIQEIDGGVTISQDNEVINYNTFASRLAKVQILISGEVSSILYA